MYRHAHIFIYSSCSDIHHCAYWWSRVPSQYDSDAGVLTINHTPEADAVQYAYFAPYTYDRHQALVARMQVGTRRWRRKCRW